MNWVELREMRESDRHYVLSSWLKSYVNKGRDWRDYADHGHLCDDYVVVVRGLLARSRVLVACLADNDDVIVGWSAWEGDVLHYVVTKPGFRQLGVARWMLKDFVELPVAYTHRTSDSQRCHIPSEWTYRRYRIWPAEEKAA